MQHTPPVTSPPSVPSPPDSACATPSASASITRSAPITPGAPVASSTPLDHPVPPPGTMGPPVEFTWLREHCPVTRVRTPQGVPAWYVTRYEDVRDLIGDRRLIRPTIEQWPSRPDGDGAGEPGLTTMMELEGPEHMALRRALSEWFSPRAVRGLLPAMRATADELLEGFAAGGRPGDLVAGFVEPFPLLVMCDLVGIPRQDAGYFLPLADVALGALITLEEGRAASGRLRAYIESVIDAKRRSPADDILSDLVAAHERGELTEESVRGFGLSMLVAGYRTSTMFLANAVVSLLADPARYARLRDEPGLMPTAVEELLRHTPVQNGVVVLLATEDIRLRGQTIRAGDAVLPVHAAANRDATVFPDADRLDLDRADNPHLTFGRGPHNCIGSHLARAQMTVGLAALLGRFPGLRAAHGQEPAWDDASPAKSPLTLPVEW